MADIEGSSARVLRQTGRLETLHVARNALGLYTSVMVGAQYHSASGKLDKDNLYPALHRAIHREPALRMAIIGSRVPVRSITYPAFISCEVDDRVLDRICVFRDDIRWDDEHVAGFTRFMEAEFGIGFDVDDISIPLWRVVVCGDNTVLFFYHHAMGDGKSGVAFHAMLLEALNSDVTPPSQPLVPSIEDSLDVRPSIGKILSTIIRVFFPPSLTSFHRGAWTGNPVPVAKNTEISRVKVTDLGLKCQLRIELLELSSHEANKLLAVCRKHGATITSALYTMAIAVFSQIIMKDINTAPNTPFSRLATYVPVSLRPISGAPEVAICDHPSTWPNFPDLQPEFRWEDAKTYADTLKSLMKSGKVQQEIGLLSLLFGNYAGFMRGRLGKKRGGTFEISNVGRFPASEDARDGVDGEESGVGRCKVGKTIFGQSSVIMDAALNFSVVGHGSGGITVSMIWGPYTLDEELAMKIVRSMKAELKSLIVDSIS